MRRTHRGGSRSQRWQQQRHNDAPIPVPLMPDHLGLQDIDKELELLQRKRVIIEHQQMLSQDFLRNEPQFNQSSRYDDYSKLYDDMRTYDHPSRKRPIAVWEQDIPNKRFSGPSRAPPRAPPRARPQRPGPVFNAGYQGAQPRVPFRASIKPSQTKTPPKNFNNSKVTKKTTPMNKLDTYPVAERKKLIGEANGTPDGITNNAKLRSDREPSAQMTGRLELALGSIIKDIKMDPEYADAVKSVSVVRQIKKIVRDRIREVMMDQIVGPGDAIKARYRQVYDVQSDKEIVEKAVQYVANKMPKIVSPEEYYKINMTQVVEARLNEMLETLAELTCGNKKTPSTDDPAAAAAAADNLDQTLKDEASKKFENQEMFVALEKLMSHRINRAIAKQIPHIIHVQNLSAQFLQLKNAVAMETIKKLARKNFTEDIASAALKDISTTQAPKSPYIPLPYYAKLMGKPGLPKRNLMQAFFEDYQPKSIKKHRSVHNLLFVGFEDKESLDKLLTADGTKIGKSTISIRVSERNQANSKPDQNSVKAELDTSTSSDKIIGSELDEQITKLLTDIKNDTEDQVDEASPEVKKEGDSHNEESTEEPENTDKQETDADTLNTDADDTEANNKNTDENSTPQTDEAVDNIENTNTQDSNGTQPEAEKEDAEKADAVPEVKTNIQGSNGTQPEVENENAEKADAVPEITDGKLKGTPVRTSARLASTPSRIQTRRASRLVSNDA